MKTNQTLLIWRIYFSNFISCSGSWLTFLGIALLVGEKYGTQQVAYTFLIQSIPPLILSRGLNTMIPSRLNYFFFQASQILLAVNVGLLAFKPTLIHIYIYLLIASCIKTVFNPVSNAVIGQWVEDTNLSAVFTRVGAIQSGTLALAPALGGWLAIRAGFHWLFIVDAATFLVSALLLCPKPTVLNPEVDQPSKFRPREILTHFVSKPDLGSKATSFYLGLWFLFLSVGAYLNAIEFPIFSLHHLTKEQIGTVIAMWGAGNLLAFLTSHRASWLRQLGPCAAGYMLGLAVFLFLNGFAVAQIGFFVAGFTYTNLGGEIRSLLQKSAAHHPHPLTVWAFANQVGSLINILFYGGVGWLLTRIPITVTCSGLSILSLLFLFGSLRMRKITVLM